jgi:hypothetical protein
MPDNIYFNEAKTAIEQAREILAFTRKKLITDLSEETNA